jgi:DNA-binding SARP family transcriptional activator
VPPRISDVKQLRFSVLGPLVVDAGGPLEPGPLKQRLTLAMLLARANTTVTTDLLTEVVWAHDPPRTARKNLQVYVCNVRRLLEDGIGAGCRLVHDVDGYLLRVAPDELDSLRFRQLARAGRDARRAGALTPAAQSFRQALRLWRGAPFAGLHRSAALAAEADRLTTQHLQVFEDWAETELELGNCATVADGVADLAERHPKRERLRAAQMTALFRCGRQTEALQVFEEVRRQLAADYGLQPTPALEALYRSMLADRRHRSVTSAVPQALPHDLPDFVGRREQKAEVTEAVRHGADRVVVLSGPAGVGKTVLAVHLAHRLTNDFPDGRILLRMRDGDGTPRPPADILAELAALTGLTDRMTGHPAQDSGIWRTWLDRHRILLVLDDAVDEAAVRPLIPAEGGSAVLVTARRRMAGLASAHRVDVPCLAPAEAVELLARIVGAERVDADRAAAYDVVTATGMLPLAVRVGGLKLATMRYLPLREYADRLAATRTVLDELVAGDLAVRPRIADSWYGMSAAHRTDVSRLASLPAPVLTLEDAATTLACPPDEARRRLEALIDTGAILSPQPEVTADAVRYELPALVRLYARELMPAP